MVRFGEAFDHADPTDRLDIHVSRAALPECVLEGRKVRSALIDALKVDGWPEMPRPITSVDAFMNAAKREVSRSWNMCITPMLQELCSGWAAELDLKNRSAESNSEHQELLQRIAHADDLEPGFFTQQLRTLEPLRSFLPVAWRTIVMLSSERQHAAVRLLIHWTKELIGNADDAHDFEERTGTKPAEMQLFFEIAGILGKYFDHAYLKQEELAGLPGGTSAESPLRAQSEQEGTLSGLSHVYDKYRIPTSDDYTLSTFATMFPAEWPKIVARLRSLAEQTQHRIDSGVLPESYAPLPAYLRTMADIYGSQETNPAQLKVMHDETLASAAADLLRTNCPLTLIRMCFPHMTGPSKKADIEVRVGFRNREMMQLERQWIQPFRTLAQTYVDEHRASFAEEYSVPSQCLNLQLAYGYNLYWLTRGDSADASITYAHANAVADCAERRELQRLKRAFPSLSIDPQRFRETAIRDTACHEYGHMLAMRQDRAVQSRIGNTSDADKIDEVKADLGGMKILSMARAQGLLTDDDLAQHVLSKLADALSYLEMSETNDYHCLGVIIVSKLIETEVIQYDGIQYHVDQPGRAIGALVSIADTVLENFYLNPHGTPEQIQEFIATQMEKKKDQRIQHFLRYLRSVTRPQQPPKL